MNEVMGNKLWLHWIQNGTMPWGKTWKRKYAPDIEDNGFIRLTSYTQWSCMWNVAWSNKDSIKKQGF